GIKSRLVYSEDGTKANVWATIGADTRPGVVLSGHTDVVPAERDGWESSPWELTERHGKWYGRGSCDMKGFIAVCLAFVPDLVAARVQTPVHLCFSYDEEVGCIGVHRLVEDLHTLNYVPKIAIIGEPTMMQLIRGHKGKMLIKCRVSGKSGHSSYAPYQVNAVEYAARAIGIIADRAQEFARKGPFNTSYTVPHTTMLTTLISGGVATNITPDSAVFSFEIRNIPEHPGEEILLDLRCRVETLFSEEIKKRFPEVGVDWETEFSYPGMSVDEDTEGYRFIKEIHPSVGNCVSYGSEGGIFQQEGKIPAILCGPGNIEQAHKRNEFVEKDQIVQCVDFMKRLIKAL
ncbi:MAG: acetylornithine deacetylase, partial [Proteobacteria bacterium]